MSTGGPVFGYRAVVEALRGETPAASGGLTLKSAEHPPARDWDEPGFLRFVHSDNPYAVNVDDDADADDVDWSFLLSDEIY